MPAKFHQNPRFWKISVNFYRNSTHRSSLNFSSNSISNLDEFLWGKLFLISISFYPYFIWNFWSQLGPHFDQISLNYFKQIQINAKPYCSSGLGHPAFFAGRPTRAHALHRTLYGHLCDRSRGARTRGTSGASISRDRWLRARPRQAPMHLNEILEFFYSSSILIVFLGCALGDRSWINTLVALWHLSDLSLWPLY
jgi:hypothetical protein